MNKGETWSSFKTPLPPSLSANTLGFNAKKWDWILFTGQKCESTGGWGGKVCHDEVSFSLVSVSLVRENGWSSVGECLDVLYERCIRIRSSTLTLLHNALHFRTRQETIRLSFYRHLTHLLCSLRTPFLIHLFLLSRKRSQIPPLLLPSIPQRISTLQLNRFLREREQLRRFGNRERSSRDRRNWWSTEIFSYCFETHVWVWILEWWKWWRNVVVC